MQKTVTCKITVCDVCEKENVTIGQCILCRRDYCKYTCSGYFPDSPVAVPVCSTCASHASTHAELTRIVNHFGRQLASLVENRDAQIVLTLKSVINRRR